MKKHRIPWKWLAGTAVAGLLFAAFAWEYPWIAVFAAIWLGLTILLAVFGQIQVRRSQARAELTKESLERIERDRRKRKVQRSCYTQEERAALEAHIRESLGPIVCLEHPENPESLPIDAALLAPTETCPCWRAVTLGVGVHEGGWPRAELMIPLETDWDPNDRSPFQLLWDAARQYLLVQNWVGPGSACKGSVAFINAGFAGGVLYDGLEGLPDPAPANLPGMGPVIFYWLMPLKKPEWDYAKERGLDALERRMENPASYLARTPWVNAETWFEEDTLPFAWSTDGELYCLGMDEDSGFQELFLKAGIAFGYGMQSLAEEYMWMYQRDDVPFIEYSCESRTFFAASRDEEILRTLALGLSDLLRYQPRKALAMLTAER